MTELTFVFWYWWVISFILLVFELLTPGYFFMWIAISRLVTGILVFLIPIISLNMQILVFSVMSIVAIMVWKFYGKKHPIETDQPLLNKRGAQYIGRVFNLFEPIVNGQGKIKVDDSIWKVRGEDCDIKTRVKVIACRGTVFDVEKID
jgi:membrane protein implicated in regulation of membrane protease activity